MMILISDQKMKKKLDKILSTAGQKEILNWLKKRKKKLFSQKFSIFCLFKRSSEMVNTLTKSLEKFLDLESLTLGFKHCPKINDHALENFSEKLKKLSRLQSIRLEFADCWGITDPGLAHIYDGLKGLTELIPFGQTILILLPRNFYFYFHLFFCSFCERRKIRKTLFSVKISLEKRALQKSFSEQL